MCKISKLLPLVLSVVFIGINIPVFGADAQFPAEEGEASAIPHCYLAFKDGNPLPGLFVGTSHNIPYEYLPPIVKDFVDIFTQFDNVATYPEKDIQQVLNARKKQGATCRIYMAKYYEAMKILRDMRNADKIDDNTYKIRLYFVLLSAIQDKRASGSQDSERFCGMDATLSEKFKTKKVVPLDEDESSARALLVRVMDLIKRLESDDGGMLEVPDPDHIKDMMNLFESKANQKLPALKLSPKKDREKLAADLLRYKLPFETPPAMLSPLTRVRNKAWMLSICEGLEKGWEEPSLYFFGKLHLGDKSGIVKLLLDSGYELRRVTEEIKKLFSQEMKMKMKIVPEAGAAGAAANP